MPASNTIVLTRSRCIGEFRLKVVWKWIKIPEITMTQLYLICIEIRNFPLKLLSNEKLLTIIDVECIWRYDGFLSIKNVSSYIFFYIERLF